MMCSLLDDTNKVSRGDWSLATFNSDEEVMDMSTVLQFADAKVRQIPLWIAQARVLSDEDAQKTGTPFWNENPCTGPVNVENASLEDIEEIRRQISESCLYLAFNDETNESMETDCQYSAVGFICELALDAQPFKYTRGDDEMLMDRVKIPYSKTYVGPKTDQRFKVMFKGSRRVADYST